MDYELTQPNVMIPAEANTIVKTGGKSEERQSMKNMIFQICSKRGHAMTNCYYRFNFLQYPAMHSCYLTSLGLPVMTTYSPPAAGGVMGMWYPNSRATSQIGFREFFLSIIVPILSGGEDGITCLCMLMT